VSSRSGYRAAASSAGVAQPLGGLRAALRGPHAQRDDGGDEAGSDAMMSVSSTEM
jgi:hypothetical protein